MRKLKLTASFTFVMLMACAATLQAQLTFKTTSPSVIAYYEYLPQGYNSNSNKYPIVFFLHGIGEKGPNTTDVNVLKDYIYKVAKLGPPKYVKAGTQFPFILVAPQLKSNSGNWPTSYVLEVINHVKKYLRVDERRIYITGLSLGGGGTWTIAQDYAKLFAAVAPVCGGYNSPSKAVNIARENVPVWAFHGDKDTVVPMSKTVNMVNAINGCTPKPSPLAKLTIYPGVAHNAWDYAYKPDHSVHNPNVYEWMMKFTNTTNGGNKIPVANAGADKSVSGTSTTIAGSGSDTDGTIASYVWTKISGPAATLTNTLTRTLSVSKMVAGTYTFRLTVKDNSGNTDSDYVKVTVGSTTTASTTTNTSTTNAAPVAYAGANLSIVLPRNYATILGSGKDSDGSIVSYTWTKLKGGAAALSGANTSKLTVTGLVAGWYVFRLTVKDDKGATDYDDMGIQVNTSTASILKPNSLDTNATAIADAFTYTSNDEKTATNRNYRIRMKGVLRQRVAHYQHIA